jgi:hypothetical protein
MEGSGQHITPEAYSPYSCRYDMYNVTKISLDHKNSPVSTFVLLSCLPQFNIRRYTTTLSKTVTMSHPTPELIFGSAMTGFPHGEFSTAEAVKNLVDTPPSRRH